MDDFDYAAPTTIQEAVDLLGQRQHARLLAGGTDLIVQLREGPKRADLVVDIKKIPELTALRWTDDGGLSLGAAVPCYRIHGDEQIQREYPGVVDAARIIGAWQIQSRASLGGNLCNASPAADSAPILLAYGARLLIAGPAGRRELPLEEFFISPGRTALLTNEILVAIELPPQPERSGAHYLRFIPRNEMDIAVVGCGAWLEFGDGAIRAARVALGAVAPTPVLANETNRFLLGQPATAETFAQAGELAKHSARPISDMRGPAEYRLHLVGVLVRRALEAAAKRANGRS